LVVSIDFILVIKKDFLFIKKVVLKQFDLDGKKIIILNTNAEQPIIDMSEKLK
jgi:hypothetical protein